LLKEIHHRVKNNLQLISSLLRLQAADIGDEKVESHFNEAVDRIKSMSLIHEKMYQQDELAKLDLQEYLEALVNEILASHSSNKSISINVHSELTQVNIKNIVPIALLFNELIINSLKHAFTNHDKGEINISVIKNENGFLISYADNGTWVEPTKASSFGFELIDTLCQQLDGSCIRDINKGTSYNIQCRIIV